MTKDWKAVLAVLLLVAVPSTTAGTVVDDPGSGLPSGDLFSGSGSPLMIVIEIESTDPVTEMDSNTTVELCARLESMFEEGVEVTLLVSTENDTAGLEDFIPLEKVPLTLSFMNPRNCINVTIIGDGFIEANESFYAVFEVADNTTLPVTIIPPSCQISVSILDDDGAILLLDISNDTLLESGEPTTVCVILSDDMDGLEREVTFTAAVIPVTADPDDFVVNKDNVEFVFLPEDARNSQICFNVSAIDDMLVEEDEVIMVRTDATNTLDVIIRSDMNDSAMEVDGFSVATATITIEDDDGIVVELDSTTTVVVVEGIQVMICVSVVSVGDGLRRDATFIPTQVNGTASAEDYMIQSSLSIPSESMNGTQHCFYIFVIDDNVTEEEEPVTFSLDMLDPNDVVEQPSTFSFIIRDALTDINLTLSSTFSFTPTQIATSIPLMTSLSSTATEEITSMVPPSTSLIIGLPSSSVQSINESSSFTPALSTFSFSATISSSMVITPTASEVPSTTLQVQQPQTPTPSPTGVEIAVSTSESILLSSSDVQSIFSSSSLPLLSPTSSIPLPISATETSSLLSLPSLTSSLEAGLSTSFLSLASLSSATPSSFISTMPTPTFTSVSQVSQPQTPTPSPTGIEIAVSSSEFFILSSNILSISSISSFLLTSSSALFISSTSSIPFTISATETPFSLSPTLTPSLDIDQSLTTQFLATTSLFSPTIAATTDLFLTLTPEVSSSVATLAPSPTQSSAAITSNFISSPILITVTTAPILTPSVSISESVSMSSAMIVTPITSGVATPSLSSLFSISSSFMDFSSQFISASISPTPSISLQITPGTSSLSLQLETSSLAVVEETPTLTPSPPVIPTPSPSFLSSVPLTSSQEVSLGISSTVSTMILMVPSSMQSDIVTTSELTVSTQLPLLSPSSEVIVFPSSSVTFIETSPVVTMFPSSSVASIETSPVVTMLPSSSVISIETSSVVTMVPSSSMTSIETSSVLPSSSVMSIETTVGTTSTSSVISTGTTSAVVTEQLPTTIPTSTTPLISASPSATLPSLETVTSTSALLTQTPSITSTSVPAVESITSVQQLLTTALMIETSAVTQPLFMPTTSFPTMVVTMAQPTQTPVPDTITENSVVVELEGFTLDTFTPDVLEEFRNITASIINEFCQANPEECGGIQVNKRQAAVFVEPDDIIITNIRETENGVEFDLFVRLDDGMIGTQETEVLPLAVIVEAVEDGMEEYARANFTVEVTPVVPPPSPSPTPPGTERDDDGLTDAQIVGIVVGSAVGFAVLLGLLLLIVCCCIRIKGRQRRSKYTLTTAPGTSYGMTYRGEPIMEFTVMNENAAAGDNESVHSVRLAFAENYSDGSSDEGQEDIASRDKITHF